MNILESHRRSAQWLQSVVRGGEMEQIQQLIENILNDSRPVVLATIVHVEGSAYRKEGAWMLIQADNLQLSVISGGCLESELHIRAQELFNTGRAEIHRYDLRAEDDLGWGRGAGCNGVVTVMIRDVDPKFRLDLAFVNEQLQAKHPVLFSQSMNEFDRYTFNRADDLDAVTPFQNVAGQTNVDGEVVYRQLLWPRPDLYIIGAGIDARPLADLAASIGYAVHMLDWRGSLCNEVHFPMAESFHVGNIVHVIGSITFSSLDSVVIMTHDFQRDLTIMRRLSEIQLLYLGILGSKKRTERLLDGEIPKWIHSPIGLSIGADGPKEIAISIVAELIAVRRRKII